MRLELSVVMVFGHSSVKLSCWKLFIWGSD